MILLDAGVLLAAEDADDAQHRAARELLRTGALATVDLAIYEVVNVAETRWKDPAASHRLQQRLWAIAKLGTLVRVDAQLAAHAATLAREHSLSGYAAAYVAAAERLGAALVSCDNRDLVSRGLARLPSQALDPS
jgi:predicted nucleic acid-binding protein